MPTELPPRRRQSITPDHWSVALACLAGISLGLLIVSFLDAFGGDAPRIFGS